MKSITQKELDVILKEHELWLGSYGIEGKCANLRDVDLRDVNLIDTNLRGANLRDADLRGVDLRYANLRDTDLRDADLRDTDLRDADLRGADLIGADLSNAETDAHTAGIHLACPEKGSFIAYKKASNCLIKLLVLDDSKRSSATSLKCRCDKAKVLTIVNIETDLNVNEAISNYDNTFVYEVGKMVSVDNFDNNRWNECSTGIHFFINKENALNY